jgi:hypothetical protein
VVRGSGHAIFSGSGRRALSGLVLSVVLGVGLSVFAQAQEPSPQQQFVFRSGMRELPLALYLDGTSRRGFVTVGEGPGRYVSEVYALWKAMVADLDGDGVDEIVLGVWSQKPVPGEPSPHRTLWAMRWDGARIVPIWRGSALARPLRDAMLSDLDGQPGDELLALDTVRGVCSLTVYRFGGFGFHGIGRRVVSCGASFTDSPGCLLDGGRRRCAQLVEGKLAYR